MNTFELSTQVVDNVQSLDYRELKKLQELTTEIFADDEFTQCTQCDTVFSWDDLIKNKDEEVPPHKYNTSSICCPKCKSYTLKKMYGEAYIDILKTRFTKAVHTSLSISTIA